MELLALVRNACPIGPFERYFGRRTFFDQPLSVIRLPGTPRRHKSVAYHATRAGNLLQLKHAKSSS